MPQVRAMRRAFNALGALVAGVPLCRPAWSVLPGGLSGGMFLLARAFSASMTHAEKLSEAPWRVAVRLGFVSTVFDNVPLTALARKHGDYDGGFASSAGGSMLWFGSSAGVALSAMYAQSKAAVARIRRGWHVTLSYVIGFSVRLAAPGWHRQPRHAGTSPLSDATSAKP